MRRFNFLLYQDWDTQSLWPLRNPDVTVRSRGVMEKCTYCVQRISQARIAAKLDDRQIRDGEIVTACQAACPTNAIVFGNINDPGSQVAKLKSSPRNYSLLAELNNRPRTTYLALVRNPNAALEPRRRRGRRRRQPVDRVVERRRPLIAVRSPRSTARRGSATAAAREACCRARRP